MTTNTHPSQRISKSRDERPLGDLRATTTALHDALTVPGHGVLDDYEIAGAVWLAGRVHAEALAALAGRLHVDIDDLTDAIEDPDEFPELAARVDALVEGIVRRF